MQIHVIPHQTSAMQAQFSMHEFEGEGKGERGNEGEERRGLDGE